MSEICAQGSEGMEEAMEEERQRKKKERSKLTALEKAHEEKLDAFNRRPQRCWNCKKEYADDENNDAACAWHLGPASQHTANQNHLDRVLFKCCGAEQIGTSPILVRVYTLPFFPYHLTFPKNVRI